MRSARLTVLLGLFAIVISGCVRSTSLGVGVEPEVQAQTSVAPMACPVLVTGRDKPRELAVDATHVYWVEPGAGRIVRAPKRDAATIEEIVRGVSYPQGFAVHEGHVYFTMKDGVSRVPKGGGAIEIVAAGQDPWGTALGASGSRIFWGNRRRDRDEMIVSSAPTEGAGALAGTILEHWTGPRQGARPPSSIVSADGVVYVAMRSGDVLSGTRDGTLSALANVHGLYLQLAVDADYVYAATFTGGTVVRIEKAAGTVTKLHEGGNPTSVAVHGDRVIFADAARGELLAVPKAGGQATVLCNGLSQPLRIVADDEAVYYTSYAGGTVGRYLLSPVALGSTRP